MDTYLDRLELHGFKSFPEKTVLKFHKGITAVIGPNGCGKSNIVDSVLWVMGEQKIKNLRGENNEDLIFNGSSSKKPLGMTEVGAHFQDKGEEIFIARRFFRSGESKYILNERFCRNRDIQDVLFKLRLGGTNYFIFEQGSIEKLVSLKPSEKRVLIEEAADISKYLVRKKETVNKLIIAEQNLDNLQILTADKENRLKELRNQVNYVQRYRKVKNDKVDHLRTLLKKKHNIFQVDFKGKQAEIEKLLGSETTLVKEIGNDEKHVLRVEEKRWLIDKELKQNQQKIFDYNKKIISAKNEIDRSKQSRTFKKQRTAEIKNSMDNNKNEITTIDKQMETNAANIKVLEEKVKKETAGYEQIETNLVDLNDKLENTNTENASLKTEIFNVQSEMTRIANKIKDIDKNMMRIENQVETKKNFANQLRNQISTDEINEAEKEFNALNSKQAETEKLFREAEARYKENRRKVDELSGNSKNCKDEIRNLENQKAKYLQIKKKIVGDSVDVSSIKHHGLLQDLVVADKKHHQLLENFYNEEMDAVILEESTDITGMGLNKCLLKGKKKEEWLKRIDEIKKEPGFICRVKELYTLKNPNLAEVFKDGVLVDSLKNGLNLFTRYGVDVVTENAETITRDGLMIRNRDKGILDVIEEIREIDEKKQEMVQKSEKINEELEKERAQQPQLSQHLDSHRSQLQNMEKKLLQLKTSLDTMKKNRENNLKRIEFTESEIELLQAEGEKLQDEFEIVDVQNGELEEKFERLNQQREQFREEVQLVKEEINRIEKEYLQKENAVNLVKEKINSSNFTLKNLKNTKSRLESTIKNDEQEVIKLNGEILELKDRETVLNKELEEWTKLKDSLEEVVKKQELDFDALNKQIKESSTHLNQLRRSLEEIKEEKKGLEIQISSIKKDLFQLEDTAFKELSSELSQLEVVEELAELDMEELENRVDVFNERMIKMRDSNRLNFSAESEFELLTKDYNFLLTQKDDVVKSIEDMNSAIQKIDEESRVSFTAAFKSIKEYFEKNFQILFEGGEAELSLMDPDNVLESGLEIKAQPPGKRLLSLKLLSGGEKTLTSLAFLFALFEYKPSPFCVFDEVDASLDEANIQRFLKFLHKLKEKTQFLIITHNFKTMEEADYIYGISMNEPGISTVYSMKMTGKGKFERASTE